jgi:glycerol uptake facilitator-like aquaporin
MIFNRSLIAEFLGSLLLCLALSLGHNPAATAGLYVVLFYSFGGQYNPVLTVASYLGGQITLPVGLQRLAAQGIGALAASLLGLIWYYHVPAEAWDGARALRILGLEIMASFVFGLAYLRFTEALPTALSAFTGVLVGLAFFAAVSCFEGALAHPTGGLTGVIMGRFPIWILLTALVGPVVGVFAAAYVANWWKQPEPPPAAAAPEAVEEPAVISKN